MDSYELSQRKRVIMEALTEHGPLNVDDLKQIVGANHMQATKALQALARDGKVVLDFGRWKKIDDEQHAAKGTP